MSAEIERLTMQLDLARSNNTYLHQQLQERDAEIAELKQQMFGDGGLVQEVADLQAKGERVEQERDDYKRQLDWAHDALDKIGAPRFPNDYPCSPEQDAYRGRGTAGTYLVKGRIAAYVDQANEKLEAMQRERDEVFSQLNTASVLVKQIGTERDAALAQVQKLQLERDIWKNVCQMASDNTEYLDAERRLLETERDLRQITAEAERDAALARAEAAEADCAVMREALEVALDLEHSQCGSEDRINMYEKALEPTAGAVMLAELQRVKAACAVMREFVSAARDWEEPKQDSRDWKLKHDRYYLYLRKALDLTRQAERE